MGKRMRAARERAGLSVKEFGRLVGREPQTVFRWEWGTTHPKIADLDEIAKVLRISVGELVDGSCAVRNRRGGHDSTPA